MSNILAAHVLSGCDILGSYFGIREPTLIKVSKNNTMLLTSIGELNSSLHLHETEGINLLLF